MSARYWKVLDEQNRSMHGGDYQWVPGEWTPRVAVRPCESGYHLCADAHLPHWLGPRIWLVEIADDAEIVAQGDKVVTSGPVRIVEESAWDETAARLFAVECATDALTMAGVTDEQSWAACEVAFRFALGDATSEELAAARAAARAARVAAWDAARVAARVAAWVAASDAAWDAASDAQSKRILWWMGAV